MFSYAGQLKLTAIADKDIGPDMNICAQGMRTTLQKLTGRSHDRA